MGVRSGLVHIKIYPRLAESESILWAKGKDGQPKTMLCNVCLEPLGYRPYYRRRVGCEFCNVVTHRGCSQRDYGVTDSAGRYKAGKQLCYVCREGER